MLKLWAFICDPLGRKRLKARVAELEARLSALPSYSAETRYMEALAREFVAALPVMQDVHPDTRHQTRIEVAFRMARQWMRELKLGPEGRIDA